MAKFQFQYGGKHGRVHELEESSTLVVRTQRGMPLAETPLSIKSRQILSDFRSVATLNCAGVQVMRPLRGSDDLRDQARRALKNEPTLQFAGRGLVDPRSGVPVVYTENLFVKFHDNEKESACRTILRHFNLRIKQIVKYSKNGYFVEAPEGTGFDVFSISKHLLENAQVEYCHPELVRELSHKHVHPMQWHLQKSRIDGKVINQSANVAAAWEHAQGSGIVIAIIDDGIDIDHPEFSGSKKVVHPWDVTQEDSDPRPSASKHNHGTACAGVACATGLKGGASGVAPKAKLMPIRCMSDLGSQNEANAFYWAADNGADIISCSWGPQDGEWWNPSDPVHNHYAPLPDSTRLAIDYAMTKGRKGKGAIVLFAAGNGNESIEMDGYASYDPVIAVAACNDMGTRSAYSDYGKSVWCTFPSNHGEPSNTPGIWTTDRMGRAGYNPGDKRKGDAEGNYTNSFGGTSSATPGVAGVVALILEVNPDLSPNEVKSILKTTAEKIDKAGGKYDPTGHSDFYGYGRVNAKDAVALAITYASESSQKPKQKKSQKKAPAKTAKRAPKVALKRKSKLSKTTAKRND